MDFLADFDEDLAADDTYDITFGSRIQRVGKIYSYTFWRTQVAGEIFWSVQGHNTDGSAWIVTQHFGPPREAKRYQQEIILHHPTEKKIKMYYMSSCIKGMNCIKISKEIIHHFKTEDNGIQFEYRLLKLKRRRFHHKML